MGTSNEQMLIGAKRLLQEARTLMITLNEKHAQSRNWDAAERALGLARSIDAIENEMGNGGDNTMPKSNSPKPPNRGPELPYYYVDNDGKLVMRGKSRSRPEGYYEQRILKDHYDLIVRKLGRMAQSFNDFYNQDLLDRSEMPVHEPGLIIKLLSKKGLLQEIRKGRYTFLKPQDLLTDASRIWSELPQERFGHSLSVNQQYKSESVQDRGYTDKHPISYTFSGTTRQVRSFRDVLTGLCENLYEETPSEFCRILLAHDRSRRGKIYFSTDSKGMNSPRKISDSGIHVETLFCADGIMKHCKCILDWFGHSGDEFTVQFEDE